MTFYKLTITILLVFSANCLAIELSGAGSSGGGAEIKKNFRKSVETLISRLQEHENPIAQAYAESFRETLNRSKFKVDIVKKLIDPVLGKPVKNQRHLYAFGSFNYIQLKATLKDDPSAASWEKMIKSNENIDPDLFHEMSWASGKGGDRDYNISIGILKLNILKNIQKERISLINTEKFYVPIPKQSFYCSYHLETDPESDSIIISYKRAPGHSWDCREREPEVYTYNTTTDSWLFYGSPDFSKHMRILPDGNFLLYIYNNPFSESELKSQDKIKYTHLRKLILYKTPPADRGFILDLVDGYSISTPNCSYLGKYLSDRMLEMKNLTRTDNQTFCENIYEKCEFRYYKYENYKGPGGGSRCRVIAIFEGFIPRIQ